MKGKAYLLLILCIYVKVCISISIIYFLFVWYFICFLFIYLPYLLLQFFFLVKSQENARLGWNSWLESKYVLQESKLHSCTIKLKLWILWFLMSWKLKKGKKIKDWSKPLLLYPYYACFIAALSLLEALSFFEYIIDEL